MCTGQLPTASVAVYKARPSLIITNHLCAALTATVTATDDVPVQALHHALIQQQHLKKARPVLEKLPSGDAIINGASGEDVLAVPPFPQKALQTLSCTYVLSCLYCTVYLTSSRSKCRRKKRNVDAMVKDAPSFYTQAAGLA